MRLKMRHLAKEAQTSPKTPKWWMDSPSAEAAQWRAAQSNVDSDIEGLARDTDADALMQQMDAEFVPFDEQRVRLMEFYKSKYPDKFL
jgi:hypothetical protein